MTEIDKIQNNDAKMFKAVKSLERKNFENPIVYDKYGKYITTPSEMYTEIKDHFKDIFYKPNVKIIEPFDGPPRLLNDVITYEEVEKSIKKLNNRRSAGFDNISAELIKYGTPELIQLITNVLNSIFEGNKDFKIGNGILVPIQNANKPKGPIKNLRPITLLPIISTHNIITYNT